MNIYAVGDVHGQFFKLKKLMEKLFIKEDDLLVFVGDYIDRGHYSFEVIEYLIKLKEKHNCVFLRGNHEDMFMDYMSGIHEDVFVYNGGRDTVKSYRKHGYEIGHETYYIERKMPRAHIEFFQKLKMYHETEDYIFVHAALWPQEGLTLENQPSEVLLWERQHFIKSKFDWGKRVIFGHTSFQKPFVMDNKIGIDTGACYEEAYGGGYLTCVKLPEVEFISQGATLEDLDD